MNEKFLDNVIAVSEKKKFNRLMKCPCVYLVNVDFKIIKLNMYIYI